MSLYLPCSSICSVRSSRRRPQALLVPPPTTPPRYLQPESRPAQLAARENKDLKNAGANYPERPPTDHSIV